MRGPITGRRAPGYRMVHFDLDPHTAAQVYFHLAASMHAEETSSASRVAVAALLPQLSRAIAVTGYARKEMLDAFVAHINGKPAPPPIDVAMARLAAKS